MEGTHKFVEIGQALSSEFKKYGYKVADKEMGYCLAKMLSCCVKDLRTFVAIWDKRRPIKNDKSLNKLKMKGYKSFNSTIIGMGWSLINFKTVEDKTKDKK